MLQVVLLLWQQVKWQTRGVPHCMAMHISGFYACEFASKYPDFCGLPVRLQNAILLKSKAHIWLQQHAELCITCKGVISLSKT